ncbi:hypothetical protein [Kitasatospora sp. NPDC050543]|uniref:hypothetical protein n=1 Tax=Kitasatospora sp. NPDC050543 TaxID=3364054 RepID=UPI00378FD197
MTAPAPGSDSQSGPAAATHYTVPAQQQEAPAGYVAPGMPGAPAPYAYAELPARPSSPNIPGAVAAALGAALAGALAYGFVMKALEREFGLAAVALAAAVAWPLGKLGGRNPVLPVAGAALSALALFLGQFFWGALMLHEIAGAPFGELFGSALDVTFRVWKEDRDFYDVLFYGLALYVGFSSTRRWGSDD